MALTDNQKTSFVYKKAVASVSETSLSRDFFEEPYPGRDIVVPSQVWNQAGDIPSTAPTLADGATSGVVQYFSARSMTAVAGASNAYYLSDFVDSIPFNFGTGYSPVLTTSTGTSIPFGTNDWVVNNAAGTLIFYGGNPANVNPSTPPKISFYKYVGSKGVGGSGGVVIQEEGSPVGTANTINFVGSAVTATLSNGVATVSITGGSGGGIVIQEEGSPVGTATTINFVGAAVTATFSSGIATVAITGGGDPTVTTSSTNNAFKVPFANTTANTTGSYGLLQDSESTFTYNPSTNTLTVGIFSGSGESLTALNASNISSGTLSGDRGVSAGSSSSSFIEYNGTTRTAGQFDGGTTNPVSTTRLNYDGYLYATKFYGDGSALTGIIASGSGIVIQDEGSNVGTASTINFVGSAVTTTLSNGVATVSITGGGGGGSTVSIGDTAPSSPSAGNLWWKSDEGKLKIYYTDVDSSQWVDAFIPVGAGNTGNVGGGSSVVVSDTAPLLPSNGDLWWNSTEGNLKIYYTDDDSAQWVDAAVPLKGDAGTVQIGTVTTGETGVAASVTNSGSSSSAVLNFVLPKGNTGAAASITVGTVTTGAPGTAASVINSGTSSNAVLNFTIPRGADGSVTTSQAIAFAIALG